MEIDSFVARIREANGRLIITIPKNVADFSGYKSDELVKVNMRREQKTEDETIVE